MKYSYVPHGVCSRKIDFEIEDDKVKSVHFTGGCDGNLKAVAALIEGMDVHEAIGRIKGIKCGLKNTSCCDQLSKGLEEAVSSDK